MQVKKKHKKPTFLERFTTFTTHNLFLAMAPPSPRFVDVRHFAVEDEAGYVEHFRPEAKGSQSNWSFQETARSILLERS